MDEKKFYEILDIDISLEDRLTRASTKINSATISVRSKDPQKTIYRAVKGGRAARELDSLAMQGLFSVSEEKGIRKYEPTQIFVDFYRTYNSLLSSKIGDKSFSYTEDDFQRDRERLLRQVDEVR
jgi:hypothetical protein